RGSLKAISETVAVLQHNIEAYGPDAEHIVTECVPGGTTTASALLKALGKDSLPMVSSSSDLGVIQNKVEVARKLVDGFEREATTHGGAQYMELMKFYLMDNFQLFMTEFLSDEEFFFSRSSRSPKIILGGGVQMLAPVGYVQRKYIDECRGGYVDFLKKRISCLTTPWVTESLLDSDLGRDYFLEETRTLYTKHITVFKAASANWDIYNDPFRSPREGLGMGCLTHLAARVFSVSEMAQLLLDEEKSFEGRLC